MADEGETVGFDDLDVVLAHWHVNSWGGAEYLVTKLATVLGVDRIYTTGSPSPDESNPYGDVDFYDVTRDLSPGLLRRQQARVGRVFEYSLWEDVDWREYGDPNVLVTSGATTRSVITPDDTVHVNYCHSPPRWFYDLYHDRKDSLTGMLARPLVRYLRLRDQTIDPRVDHYLVNSPIIQRRLWKYYKRDSTVLYPPVDLDRYYNDSDDGYFLHLGRLDKEKGVPEVVEAFTGIDERLVLAGGRGDVDEDVMRRMERTENVDYRGFVSESEKYDLLARSRAVVFNGRNEDFGIVLVEANASGKPVLARDEGFPSVFIEDGENGLLHDGTPAGIRATLTRADFTVPEVSTEQFGLDHFGKQLREEIQATVEEMQI